MPEKSHCEQVVRRSRIARWLAGSLLLLLAACSSSQLPEGMAAAWVTDHPRYHGCYLLLFPHELIVGAADATTVRYTIEWIKVTPDGPSKDVTIEARDDQGVAARFYIVYSPGEVHGTFHFKNQPRVCWYRSPHLAPF